MLTALSVGILGIQLVILATAIYTAGTVIITDSYLATSRLL